MAAIPDLDKLIANRIALSFGCAPSVNRHWDDDRIFSLDVASCSDSPVDGVVSYGTIGLSNHPVRINEQGDRLAIELLGASANAKASDNVNFANVLVTAAFYTIRNDWRCVPGSVLRNALDMYKMSKTMRHLLFVPPFLWDGFEEIPGGNGSIHWLLAIPISDEEYGYWTQYGSEALEAKFEERQIDFFDIHRPSII